MMRKALIPASIIVLVAAGLLFARFYIFRPASSSVEGKSTDIRLEASELLRAFEEDEVQANTDYLDRVIAVSGLIGEIYQDEQHTTLTLKEAGDISGISCTFENSSLGDTEFSLGEEIRVLGLCTGYLIDVVLIKCALAE